MIIGTARNPRTPHDQPAAASRPEQGAQSAAEGPVVRVILVSLAIGALVALVLLLLVFGGGTEAQITGSALLGFAVGWALLGWLTARVTGIRQRWTSFAAAFLGGAGLLLVMTEPGAAGMAALSWLWPPAVLGLALWLWTQARHSLPRRGRVAVAPVLVVMVMAAAGAVYQNVAARSSATTAAPGVRYDVGGRAVHLDCHGRPTPGEATVVLVSGLGGSSASWARVSSGVEHSGARVCAYDRAGQGWSDPTRRPQTPDEAVGDLHAVLSAAGEQGPVVLVGHSTGGTYAMTYAHTYPSQVAGMVLLDSSSPEQAEHIPGFTSQLSVMRRAVALAPSLYRLGLGHLLAGGSRLPEPAGQRVTALAATPAAARNLRDEQAVILDVFTQARALRTLGDRPLAVVTASENAADPGWASAQDALARLSTHARHITVKSSHEGLLEDPTPAAASIDAIAAVVTAAGEQP